MYFRILSAPSGPHLTYLLADCDEQEAVVIDPHPEQTELIRAILDERMLSLRFVLLTHVHARQRPDPKPLCAHSGAQLVIGEQAHALPDARRVRHGEHLLFGNEVIRILGTPGHTAGCLSYLCRDRLFCGDVLDVDNCTCDHEEADPGKLFDSLTQRLFLLPAETLVFPAHARRGRTVSTIAEERIRHAHLCNGSRETFITEMSFRRPAA